MTGYIIRQTFTDQRPVDLHLCFFLFYYSLVCFIEVFNLSEIYFAVQSKHVFIYFHLAKPLLVINDADHPLWISITGCIACTLRSVSSLSASAICQGKSQDHIVLIPKVYTTS